MEHKYVLQGMWLQIMGNAQETRKGTAQSAENPILDTKDKPHIIIGDKELDHRSMCTAS